MEAIFYTQQCKFIGIIYAQLFAVFLPLLLLSKVKLLHIPNGL